MNWYVFNVDDSGAEGPADTCWGRIKVRDNSEEHARKLCAASLAHEVMPNGSLLVDYKLTLVGVYPPDQEPA